MSTYVIAELGSNHNGDYITCLRLIEAAKTAGADAAKLQLFKAEWLCHPRHPAYETVKDNELPREWMPQLVEFAREVGIQLSATPCDLEAIELLDSLDVPWIKIASGDITYGGLIRAAAATGRKLLMSVGAATQEEISLAWHWAIPAESITLLHCTMEYPCQPCNANLQRLNYRINDLGEGAGVWGFSDHTLSVALPAVAVGMGATVIEKHFTLNRNLPGADHAHSLEPSDFCQMVAHIRETELAIADRCCGPLPCEQDMRIWARRGEYNGRWLRPTREAGLE